MRRIAPALALTLLGAFLALLRGVGPAAPPVPSARDAAAPALERVEVTALADPDVVARYLETLGASIELRSQDRIQALVPVDRVSALLEARSLLRVEPPATVVPLELLSPAELIGAVRWRSAGFTGHGVRVAVLDAGFAGYRDQLGTALPAQVHAQAFRADGDLEAGTDHGTRAARIVHELAPGAELYLLNFGTVTELSAAVDFIVEEGIDVVSFSLGFIHNGPGDGTGPVNEIVSRGAAGGAVWVVAAGNWARQHWAGVFADSDGDSLHEFAPGVTQNGRTFEEGDLIVVSLRWEDEWGAACSDYDLELFAPDGSLVRASRQVQDCSGNPVEGIQVLATQTGIYGVRVVQAASDVPRQLDLMVVGSPGRGEELDIFVEGGSLSEPADHPAVITVGVSSSIEPVVVEQFSSRGPTVDGRPKPDVVSPTGLAGGLESGSAFAGTSAAAPHVAAVVALLKEAMPGAGAGELRAQISRRALDLPPVGIDDASGDGLVYLGSLVGLGLLLPVGAEEARLSGALPPGEGLALIAYAGPDGYPLRFAHLLTDGREPTAWFRFDVRRQAWDFHIVGAPPRVNDFDTVSDGDILMVRFAAPPGADDAGEAEDGGG